MFIAVLIIALVAAAAHARESVRDAGAPTVLNLGSNVNIPLDPAIIARKLVDTSLNSIGTMATIFPSDSFLPGKDTQRTFDRNE